MRNYRSFASILNSFETVRLLTRRIKRTSRSIYVFILCGHVPLGNLHFFRVSQRESIDRWYFIFKRRKNFHSLRMIRIKKLSPLQIALFYRLEKSFLILLKIFVLLYRPDIIDHDNRINTLSPRKLSDNYDFVVIGGGSAGSVIANRLSENKNWTVLLLEAGGIEPMLTDIPVIFPTYQVSPIDWQFKTEPSSCYCLGMNNRQCNWPRGKVKSHKLIS